MSLDNYANLRTAVADWLADSTLTSQIVDFFTLCEAELNRELRDRNMQTSTTFGISGSSRAYSWPADIKKPVSGPVVSASPPRTLIYKTPAQFNELDQGGTGTPTWWTDLYGQLYILPTPDTTYTVTVPYYAKLNLASTSTNWALTNHPDVYLYGILRQAAPYLTEDQRLAQWEQKYQAALESLKRDSMGFMAPQPAFIAPDVAGP